MQVSLAAAALNLQAKLSVLNFDISEINSIDQIKLPETSKGKQILMFSCD
jgi:hypothetical protein